MLCHSKCNDPVSTIPLVWKIEQTEFSQVKLFVNCLNVICFETSYFLIYQILWKESIHFYPMPEVSR